MSSNKLEHFFWNAKANSKEHADALAEILRLQIDDFARRWEVYVRRGVEVYSDVSFETAERTWYVSTRFSINTEGVPGKRSTRMSADDNPMSSFGVQ